MEFKRMREYTHEEFVELVQSLSEEELMDGYVECDDYTYQPQDRTTGYYWSQTASMESVQCAIISSSGFRTSGWPKCLTMCLRLVKKSKDK